LTAKVDMLEEKKNSLKDIETEYLAQTKILSRLDRLEECGVYLKSAEACFFKLNQILGIKRGIRGFNRNGRNGKGIAKNKLCG